MTGLDAVTVVSSGPHLADECGGVLLQQAANYHSSSFLCYWFLDFYPSQVMVEWLGHGRLQRSNAVRQCGPTFN